LIPTSHRLGTFAVDRSSDSIDALRLSNAIGGIFNRQSPALCAVCEFPAAQADLNAAITLCSPPAIPLFSALPRSNPPFSSDPRPAVSTTATLCDRLARRVTQFEPPQTHSAVRSAVIEFWPFDRDSRIRHFTRPPCGLSESD
jgi:hypothetical protein